MSDYLVTCVNKVPRNNPHEGITHLGGTNWHLTRAEVIAAIERRSNPDTFHTEVKGKRAEVEVIDGPNGKYVRTRADGVLNDNLLALKECP